MKSPLLSTVALTLLLGATSGCRSSRPHNPYEGVPIADALTLKHNLRYHGTYTRGDTLRLEVAVANESSYPVFIEYGDAALHLTAMPAPIPTTPPSETFWNWYDLDQRTLRPTLVLYVLHMASLRPGEERTIDEVDVPITLEPGEYRFTLCVELAGRSPQVIKVCAPYVPVEIR